MKQPKEPISFQRSALRVFFFTVITLGFYSYYWFYRHWKAIGVQTKTNTRPILRAVFDFVTSFALFRRLLPGQTASAIILATVYLALFIASISTSGMQIDEPFVSLAITLAGVIAVAGILATVQHYAEFPGVKKVKKAPYYPGEIVFLVIGSYFFLASFLSLAIAPQSVITARHAKIEVALNETTKKSEDAQARHIACVESLDTLSKTSNFDEQTAVDAFNKKQAECTQLGNESIGLAQELMTYIPYYFYALLR